MSALGQWGWVKGMLDAGPLTPTLLEALALRAGGSRARRHGQATHTLHKEAFLALCSLLGTHPFILTSSH